MPKMKIAYNQDLNVKYNIEEVLRIADGIYTISKNDYCHIDTLAKNLDMAPVSLREYLSAGKKYGLLEMKHGVGHKVTESYFKIKSGDKSEVLKATSLLPIFEHLMNDTNYNLSIGRRELAKHLESVYDGMPDRIAYRTARVFMENCRYGGILPALKKETDKPKGKRGRKRKVDLGINSNAKPIKKTAVKKKPKKNNHNDIVQISNTKEGKEIVVFLDENITVTIAGIKGYRKEYLQRAMQALDI